MKNIIDKAIESGVMKRKYKGINERDRKKT